MTNPPYLEIAADIERRITAGELKPGDRVPSTRQITRQWGVAIATATKALAELGARGVVQPVPGVGTVVSAPALGARAVTVKAKEAKPEQPRRARVTGEITGERIVRAAIAIADAEGLAAVSMRRVAVDLGAATMSLYRWVESKDDLLVGMMDLLLSEGEWPEPQEGWRAQLEYLARRQWAGYMEHPWLAQLVSLGRPQLAPNAMMNTEWALRAVAGHGLDATTSLFVALTLFGYVRGAAATLDAERQAELDTGLNVEEWMAETDAAFTPFIQSGRYPHIAGLDNNADVDFSFDRLFEFGLKTVLDGFAVLLDPAA